MNLTADICPVDLGFCRYGCHFNQMCSRYSVVGKPFDDDEENNLDKQAQQAIEGKDNFDDVFQS